MTTASNPEPPAGRAVTRRLLFLYNPHSREGASAAEHAIARLREGGLDIRQERCTSPAGTLAIIARDAALVDGIVLCGGDGTLSAAAPGVIASGLPMGIIPGGTANDLARTLDIPGNPERAADIILDGQRRQIDVGEVNGRIFFNVASIGISADLARGLDPGLKRRWGRLGYALAALKVLSRARPFRATIATEGASVQVTTYQIAVGNGRYYGAGMTVASSAAIDDGRLDLYSLEFASVWRMALMLPAFRKGSHGARNEVRTASAARFEVVTGTPKSVNADGELVTTTPARFIVRPRAISVFAPHQSKPAGSG